MNGEEEEEEVDEEVDTTIDETAKDGKIAATRRASLTTVITGTRAEREAGLSSSGVGGVGSSEDSEE